ncbi:MAG: DUF4339 domain-containing protein [Chthoniobacteraceae bacterium]
MNWYYESAGQQQGPVAESELDRLLAAGTINPDTLVWREGMAGWTPLRTARPSAPPPAAGANEDAAGWEVTRPGTPATQQASDAAGSDVPQPGWVRCTVTGRYFPPSEIIYIEGKPYCAAAKPQVVAAMQTGAVLPGNESGREGPAWEHREQLGMMKALIDTTKAVITAPTHTFTTMKREGGLQTPMVYYLILGSAAGILSQIIMSILQFGTMASTMGNAPGAGVAIGAGVGGLIFGIIAAPLQVCIGAFVGAGMVHGCLMLLKAANQPFETTFRTLCYLYGAMAPAQLIIAVAVGFGTLGMTTGGVPSATGVGMFGLLLGGLTLPIMIWYLYMAIVSLAATQEITRGRAAAALLLPPLVCCGGFALIAVLIGAAAAVNS